MLFLHLVIISTVFTLCKGWVIQVDTHTEDCFYEKVNKGTKLSLVYEVNEGGFLDIVVTILGPDGRELYAGTRETNGKFTFAAYEDGNYKFCFSNKMSTVTRKTVKFDVTAADEADWQQDISNRSDALQAAVAELSRRMWGINNEQQYIIARMNTHRYINKHTNKVVVRWCVFEILLIVVGMCFEVWLVKRFFEVRRVL